jgi:hypothetical protein
LRLHPQTFHSSNPVLSNKQKAPSGAFLLTKFFTYVELININKHMNKYEKWYNSIIQNAQSRVIDSYTECHHIIPRSLGGGDESSNLVDLTAKEHFICHWLLVKMHTGESRGKMINALYMMQGKSSHQKRYTSKITGRIYEHLRKEYSEYIRKQNTGNQINDEQREKIRQSKLGKKRSPFSNEWKENLKKNHKSKQATFDGRLSEETRKKIGNKIRGRKHTEEEKKRRADAIRGSKREKLLCPHCNNLISVNTYPRWHGDRCKSLV